MAGFWQSFPGIYRAGSGCRGGLGRFRWGSVWNWGRGRGFQGRWRWQGLRGKDLLRLREHLLRQGFRDPEELVGVRAFHLNTRGDPGDVHQLIFLGEGAVDKSRAARHAASEGNFRQGRCGGRLGGWIWNQQRHLIRRGQGRGISAEGGDFGNRTLGLGPDQWRSRNGEVRHLKGLHGVGTAHFGSGGVRADIHDLVPGDMGAENITGPAGNGGGERVFGDFRLPHRLDFQGLVTTGGDLGDHLMGSGRSRGRGRLEEDREESALLHLIPCFTGREFAGHRDKAQCQNAARKEAPAGGGVEG